MLRNAWAFWKGKVWGQHLSSPSNLASAHHLSRPDPQIAWQPWKTKIIWACEGETLLIQPWHLQHQALGLWGSENNRRRDCVGSYDPIGRRGVNTGGCEAWKQRRVLSATVFQGVRHCSYTMTRVHLMFRLPSHSLLELKAKPLALHTLLSPWWHSSNKFLVGYVKNNPSNIREIIFPYQFTKTIDLSDSMLQWDTERQN